MNRFLIGQYGKYDQDKQKRDFRAGFFGVEACLFKSEKDIELLLSESRKRDFQLAVHFPLRNKGWKLRDVQFMSKDINCKKYAYEQIEAELKYLSKIRPKYILFHLVLWQGYLHFCKWGRNCHLPIGNPFSCHPTPRFIHY